MSEVLRNNENGKLNRDIQDADRDDQTTTSSDAETTTPAAAAGTGMTSITD